MGEEMKPILSFTSHKARLPYIDEVFRSHVANAETCGMHVCLALQEDSVPAMTPYQRSLVDGGKIELLTVERDHGSNTKWTLCRAKYPDATMVVVDDDELYPHSELRSLLSYHRRVPSAFLCRAWRRVSWDPSGRMVPFAPNQKGPGAPNPVFLGSGLPDPLWLRGTEAIPEHWGGCLYPAGFPSTGSCEEAAKVAFHDDDAVMALFIARAALPFFAIPVYERNVRLATKRDSPLRPSGLAYQQAVSPGGPGSRTRQTLKTLEPELVELRGKGL